MMTDMSFDDWKGLAIVICAAGFWLSVVIVSLLGMVHKLRAQQ